MPGPSWRKPEAKPREPPYRPLPSSGASRAWGLLPVRAPRPRPRLCSRRWAAPWGCQGRRAVHSTACEW